MQLERLCQRQRWACGVVVVVRRHVFEAACANGCLFGHVPLRFWEWCMCHKKKTICTRLITWLTRLTKNVCVFLGWRNHSSCPLNFLRCSQIDLNFTFDDTHHDSIQILTTRLTQSGERTNAACAVLHCYPIAAWFWENHHSLLHFALIWNLTLSVTLFSCLFAKRSKGVSIGQKFWILDIQTSFTIESSTRQSNLTSSQMFSWTAKKNLSKSCIVNFLELTHDQHYMFVLDRQMNVKMNFVLGMWLAMVEPPTLSSMPRFSLRKNWTIQIHCMDSGFVGSLGLHCHFDVFPMVVLQVTQLHVHCLSNAGALLVSNFYLNILLQFREEFWDSFSILG